MTRDQELCVHSAIRTRLLCIILIPHANECSMCPGASDSPNQNVCRTPAFIQIGMAVINTSVIDPMYGAAVRCKCSPSGQSTRRNRAPRESVTWQRPPPFRLVGRDELGAAEMLIRRRRGWELRESEATPELALLGRRRLL